MKYQLRLCTEDGAQPGPGESAVTRVGPPASGAAGVAGLCWLWGLVELRLGPVEPDSAA